MDNKKNRILVFLAIAAFSNGATTQYFEPEIMFALTNFLFMFIGVILSFWLYYLDSDQIEFKRSKLLNIRVIATGLLAFPYYLFRTRHLKKKYIAQN